MVHLAAQTEDIRLKAATAQKNAAEIQMMLGQLQTAMADLSSTWQGPASSKFHGLYLDWNNQATKMQGALDDIGKSLNAVGTSYENLESELASKL
jgi:WXG100 family type VII secretion target